MPTSDISRARLDAFRAVRRQQHAAQNRVGWKRAYLGDGAGALLADRAQFYLVRLEGSDDSVTEVRLSSSTWLVMQEGLCVWLRPMYENGQAYYEIAGEAPGTNWTE